MSAVPALGHALGLYPRHNRRVPHISLVFREMWDTAGLPLKPMRSQQLRTGAPCSHQRTWAEDDGRSPSKAFRCGPYRLFIRTGAGPDFLLRTASYRHVCGSPYREPHAIDQRHHPRQEIRGSVVEGPAVLSNVVRQGATPKKHEAERGVAATSNRKPPLRILIWSSFSGDQARFLASCRIGLHSSAMTGRITSGSFISPSTPSVLLQRTSLSPYFASELHA
jgi:hypothetical protein